MEMRDPLAVLAELEAGQRLTTTVSLEKWRLAKPFVIARGAQDAVDLPVVSLTMQGRMGRGECCPVPHFGESAESVLAEISRLLEALANGARWSELHDHVPAGAARNAVDCAYWDLMAKVRGMPVWTLLGLGEPVPVETVMTISLGPPDAMAKAARGVSGHHTLKIKLGSEQVEEAMAAIRMAVPEKQLIVDANEAWHASELGAYMAALSRHGVLMLEQPLAAGQDDALECMTRPIPVGGDESVHVVADLEMASRRYDVVNIKLDKSGGLTEAVRLLRCAVDLKLDVMVGCMLGTSLAMAPAMLLAPHCRFVDLDAPLLMGSDRFPGLNYHDGWIDPPSPHLWG